MSTPFEWRINEIEQKAQRAHDRLWKVDQMALDIDRLEHVTRELTSKIESLGSAFETATEQVRRLELAFEELSSRLSMNGGDTQ